MSDSGWAPVRAVGVPKGTQPKMGKVSATLELEPLPDPEWAAIFNDKGDQKLPWVGAFPLPRVVEGELKFDGVERSTLTNYIAAVKDRIEQTNTLFRDKVLAHRIQTAADQVTQAERDTELRAEIQQLLAAGRNEP
jgi:hypothetical protein